MWTSKVWLKEYSYFNLEPTYTYNSFKLAQLQVIMTLCLYQMMPMADIHLIDGQIHIRYSLKYIVVGVKFSSTFVVVH